MIKKIIYIFLLLSTYQLLLVCAQERNFLLTFLEFLQRGQADMNREAEDEKVKLQTEYDFIVVGAGTAGCAMAARLSENPKWKVLLLEAGGPESLIMDVPILAHFLQLGEMNWKYQAQKSDKFCQAMANKRCNWPRGKVMGGSSVLNYMMYTRGNYRDYDRWAELGNEGWSWKDVLPYFKKFEGSTISDADRAFVGRNGPVKISYTKWHTKAADAFVQAAHEDGLELGDYNGRIQTRSSYLQSTTYNGIRWSSNRAYLYPLKGKRLNLHVKKYALVTRVLIDPETKTAYGVLFETGGKTYKVLAKREVILSAGAINTPQLLMLSGVGPAAHLREMGIKPLADLAVGFNLQDHIATPITLTSNATALHFEDFFEIPVLNTLTTGDGSVASPGGVEAIAFWDLDHPEEKDGWADIELFLIAGPLSVNPAILPAFGIDPDIFNKLFRDIVRFHTESVTIFPMILRPKSRGRIMLKNKNPHKYPKIFANYFAHPYDIDIMVRGIYKIRSLLDLPAFRSINAKFLDKIMPNCEQHVPESRPYWECYVRQITLTIYHYAGTAKMGPKSDRTAVVDPRLRVYGINNLRVVDASIMPELIAGHPNGPVFMIAEKAADMIKQDHNYI